jgi:hypothetical protein
VNVWAEDSLVSSTPCPTASGGTQLPTASGPVSSNSDPAKLGVTKSTTVNGTFSKGGPFTPEVRAFLDTIAKYESGLDRSQYSAGNNNAPNDFDANGSTDLHPALKSKGIYKTTVKDCTTAVPISEPFFRACFDSNGVIVYTEGKKVKEYTGDVYVSGLNIGKYQYYGDHVTVDDKQGVKSKNGFINSSPPSFADDVNKANQSLLSKAGIDFVIKDFKPSSQDFYPLGKWAFWASQKGEEPNLEKALKKYTGSEADFKKVTDIAKLEWASAPGGAQAKNRTVAEYFETYNSRLKIYKAEK